MPSVGLTIVAWLIYVPPGPVGSDHNDLNHPCSDNNNVANLISLLGGTRSRPVSHQEIDLNLPTDKITMIYFAMRQPYNVYLTFNCTQTTTSA